jgi:hypothetical protein
MISHITVRCPRIRIAEIFDMRYLGETVCVARQIVEKRLVEAAVDQAGSRALKLVAHPSRAPYLDIEVIRKALDRFPEGRAKGVATRPVGGGYWMTLTASGMIRAGHLAGAPKISESGTVRP